MYGLGCRVQGLKVRVYSEGWRAWGEGRTERSRVQGCKGVRVGVLGVGIRGLELGYRV